MPSKLCCGTLPVIRESELLGEKANFPSVSFENLQISLLPVPGKGRLRHVSAVLFFLTLGTIVLGHWPSWPLILSAFFIPKHQPPVTLISVWWGRPQIYKQTESQLLIMPYIVPIKVTCFCIWLYRCWEMSTPLCQFWKLQRLCGLGMNYPGLYSPKNLLFIEVENTVNWFLHSTLS